MPSFIAHNMSPDRVEIEPNDATPEKVFLGYRNARKQFIGFVKKYNASKTAGTITLSAVESEAMAALHKLWKTATPDKTQRGGNYFFDMKDLHDQLDEKFPATAPPDDVVSVAWNGYIKTYSDWMQVLFESSATIFTVKM